MNASFYLFILIFWNVSCAELDTGVFWQITDIHWDLQYSRTGDNKKMCHDQLTQQGNGTLGYFGDYLCDSPYTLVSSAVNAMKRIYPTPEFILWTGDNSPHIKEDVSFDVIFKTIKNLTSDITAIFGTESPLIPVLGNHDAHPKDMYPPSDEDFYNRYLVEGGWDKVIPKEGQESFKMGGYYTYPLRPDVEIMVLNTNLYYRPNRFNVGVVDPAGQFVWMKNKLSALKIAGKKVLISAHIPPGYWERNATMPFFNDSYNERFCDIVNDFGDIIIAQIYGHEHTDSFRLISDEHGVIRSVAFLAPSVTPWFPTRLVGGTAINPSIRLYNFTSSAILSYEQFHMNLTEANNASLTLASCKSSNTESCPVNTLDDLWKIYYSTVTTFGTDVLDIDSLNMVYKKLLTNDTFFQNYFARNSAGIEHGFCNTTCKVNHICAIRYQKISKWSRCIKQLSNLDSDSMYDELFGSNSNIPVYIHSTTSVPDWVLVVSVLVVVLTCLGAIFLLTGSRRRMFFPSSPNSSGDFEWIVNSSHGYAPLNTTETA